MYVTCANEYTKEEYIPENISLYKTERSLATTAMTDEQLFVQDKQCMYNDCYWQVLMKY